MRIYLCFQYGGDEANKLAITEIAERWQKDSENICLIVPHQATGWMYGKVSYDDGMKMCYDFLETCQIMFTFGELSKSPGCMLEKDFARRHGIPILDFGSEEAEEEIEEIKRIGFQHQDIGDIM